jgi:hypothetical protein
VAFDPVAALRVFQHHDVRFVVIGGLAGRLWGSPTMTNDLDVCCAWDRPNLERVAASLVEMEARLRDVPQDVAFQLDATSLVNGRNFTFTTRYGSLDLLGEPAGPLDFADLAANARAFDIGGLTVDVGDLDDLIELKSAAGRPKDRIEVEVLRAVQRVHDEAEQIVRPSPS